MATVDWGTHYNLGCEAAHNNETGALILNYGQPVRLQNGQYGVRLHDGPGTTVGLPQVISAAENFASGYYNCTPLSSTNYLELVIGTNNYVGNTGTVEYGHGAAWAQTVNSVNQFLSTVQWSFRVSAIGGSDIELGWSTASQAIGWTNGYASAAVVPYYDYGDAAGCPIEYVGNIVCSVGWYVSDVWQVAWHNLWAWPFPEIYSRDGRLTAQWQALSVYAALSGFSPMHFDGALTQEGACQVAPDGGCLSHDLDNPPRHGWSQLWILLNADLRTQQQFLGSTSPPRDWSSDITKDN